MGVELPRLVLRHERRDPCFACAFDLQRLHPRRAAARHVDFALRDAERLGDERLQRAVGFVVLRRGADARLEIEAGFVLGAAVDAIGAAGWREADAQAAQKKPR